MPASSQRPEGRVTAVRIKPDRKAPMAKPPGGLEVRAHHGIMGDCHAAALGPRQLLLVDQETLDALGLSLDAVRANVAVAGIPLDGLPSGATLRFDGEVRLRLTHRCEVCSVLRQYVSGDAFRNLLGRRGYLAVAVTDGGIQAGSRVAVEPVRYPSVPDDIYPRLEWVVDRIPLGRVMTWDVLLEAVGGSRSYFRVLPRYLRRAAEAGRPAHRVLDRHAQAHGYVPGQRARLLAEGLRLPLSQRALERAVWSGEMLYYERA